MRILLVLGNKADTGGPTKYAQQLVPILSARGHQVEFITYGRFIRAMPTGMRHVAFALRSLRAAARSDIMLGFDTMTVGAPLLIASVLTRTPYCIRIGGDFVWEQFVESTGTKVKLSQFYSLTNLPLKARFSIWLTGRIARRAQGLVFNSAWQRALWQPVYKLDAARSHVVENLYPPRLPGQQPAKRVFVSAGRAIVLKQEPLLRKVIESLKGRYPDIELDTTSLPPAEHAARVARSYAVVLPSVSDVSPNAIIDAVVYGKPFVCTDDTGIRERLEGTGLFVDTANEQALSDAIESLLAPGTYEQVAERVRAFGLVRTWDDVGADFERVLTSICAS